MREQKDTKRIGTTILKIYQRRYSLAALNYTKSLCCPVTMYLSGMRDFIFLVDLLLRQMHYGTYRFAKTTLESNKLFE